jgi:RNA polymerase sigma factor (sigma-70 family)
MNSGKAGGARSQLEVLWTSGTLSGLSDSQLLNRYVDGRGGDRAAEAAFRELVNRHGPMVLAVCRQLLRRSHDADDAFQATFLVLVRKAGSIRVDESLAPWLCSVAYRTARRARDIAARYRPLDDPRVAEAAAPEPDDGYHLEVRPLLHEELDRLPGRFREVIVLCHLEGKSHEEAARVLRWPIGTVSSRLSRGRRLLKSRLERRGLEVAPAILSASWLVGPPIIVSAPLLESAVAAAVGSATAPVVSAVVLSLAKGVLRTMWLRKLRTVSLTLLVIGGVTSGLVWAHRPVAPRPPAADESLVPATSLARGVAPAAKSTQPAPSSQPAEDRSRLADCPIGGQDGLPEYCPITMATNAFSRMMGYFHSSSPSP